MPAANPRSTPGKRPPAPVRVYDVPPSDWQCSWSVHEVRNAAGEVVSRYWELKFINAACLEHARLAAA